jgi:GTP-binding protein
MNFEHGRFLISALKPDEFPHLKTASGKILPEVAFAGRSNAGKSSFINALLQTKALAKTSSTPGKTQRINFFVIDESLLLVDLPGYGYAKAPDSEVRNWSFAIDEYLNNRSSLRMIFLILDIRREPSKEDLLIAEWAASKHISLFIIFTKRDKLSDSEAEKSVRLNLSKLEGIPIIGSLAVSNTRLYERRQFIQMINKEILKWG